MAIIKWNRWLSSKGTQITNAGEVVEERNSCALWWECKSVQLWWKTIWSFLKKLKTELAYEPAVPLLGIYLEKTKTLTWKDITHPYVHYSIIIIFLSFCLFRATTAAYGGSRARGWISLYLLAYAAATAMEHLSHICDLHHSLRQHWIHNPLSKARAQTHILMDTGRVLNHWAMTGTPYSITFKSQDREITNMSINRRMD